MSLKLHVHALSGHSHRAQLFASLLGLEVEIIPVDLAAGAHKSPEFLKLNPFGQVPVLEDGEVSIPDSNAILIYLARKAGRSDWAPQGAEAEARVQRWLSIAAGQIAFGPAAARLVTVFGAAFSAEEVIARAHGALAQLEAELSTRDWLVGTAPTIADVAIYSYVANAPEGNVDLGAYPAVRAWLARIEALPGFIPFQQSQVGLRSA